VCWHVRLRRVFAARGGFATLPNVRGAALRLAGCGSARIVHSGLCAARGAPDWLGRHRFDCRFWGLHRCAPKLVAVVPTRVRHLRARLLWHDRQLPAGAPDPDAVQWQRRLRQGGLVVSWSDDCQLVFPGLHGHGTAGTGSMGGFVALARALVIGGD